MKLTIAWIRLHDETQSVLRGQPDAVSALFAHAQQMAGGGEIIHQVIREIGSIHEEEAMWRDFIDELSEPDTRSVAEQKYVIWRRKAGAIWGYGINEFPGAVCFFMVGQDDMLLQVPNL